jgi:hypothetical protein
MTGNLIEVDIFGKTKGKTVERTKKNIETRIKIVKCSTNVLGIEIIENLD